MLSKTMCFGIVLSLLAVIVPAGLRGAEEGKPAAIEEVWTSLEGEPFLTFQRARERFLAEDYEDAARFVRKGAAFLWLETERADAASLARFEAAAAKLSGIAAEVEGGQLTSGRSMEVAFARAHLVLAKHYGGLSLKYESLGEMQKSVRALDICAGHLLAAHFWSPEGLEDEDLSGVKKTRSALDKAGEGAAGAETAVGDFSRKLGKSMEKLGTNLRPYEGEQQ